VDIMKNLNIRVDLKTYEEFVKLKKELKYMTNEGVLIKLIETYRRNNEW